LQFRVAEFFGRAPVDKGKGAQPASRPAGAPPWTRRKDKAQESVDKEAHTIRVQELAKLDALIMRVEKGDAGALADCRLFLGTIAQRGSKVLLLEFLSGLRREWEAQLMVWDLER
jgi:hypothetical protein